jgi:hypothetical protein
MQKEVYIATQSFSKLKHSTTEMKTLQKCKCNLGDDVPNASNIEITHFEIYVSRNWENLDK